MTEEKVPRGRPKKFQDIHEFRSLIEEYFVRCDERDKPYTMTGLAYHLGTSRMLLLNIETLGHYDSEFAEEVARAKMRCEVWLEENLLTRNSNVVGSIFALKNNFGWRDKTEHEVTGSKDMAKLLEQRRRQVIEQRTVKVITDNAQQEEVSDES